MCWQLRDCILRDNRLSALTYITLMKTQILKHFQHFFTNQSFFLFQRKQLGLISQPVNRAANGSRNGSIKVSSILFEILLCKIVLPLFFRLPHTQYWGLAYQEFRGIQERIVSSWLRDDLPWGWNQRYTLTCPSHAAVRLVKNSSGLKIIDPLPATP